MAQLQVQIVDLDRIRVAAVRAEGAAPEAAALRRMRAWAGPRGLLEDSAAHPLYGFNNPYPEPGSSSYGYELWIRLDPSDEPPEDFETKELAGGRYASTRCVLADLPATWLELAAWAEQHGYRRGGQELERLLNPLANEPELEFELLLPIEPARPDEATDEGSHGGG